MFLLKTANFREFTQIVFQRFAAIFREFTLIVLFNFLISISSIFPRFENCGY